jgi:hypothetical protein
MTTAGGLIGIMIAGLIFSWLTYEIFIARTSNPSAQARVFGEADTTSLGPVPRLQPDPRAALLTLRSREDSLLGSYGWEDSARGIARVPIERAMEMYLRKAQ